MFTNIQKGKLNYMNIEFSDYLFAFLVGGILCAIGQILLDKTKLTMARILVIYVTAGVFLSAIGIYDKIVDFAKAGAKIPLTGFGYALVKGVEKSIDEMGFLGIFAGGIAATAAGVAIAIFLGLTISLFAKSKPVR